MRHDAPKTSTPESPEMSTDDIFGSALHGYDGRDRRATVQFSDGLGEFVDIVEDIRAATKRTRPIMAPGRSRPAQQRGHMWSRALRARKRTGTQWIWPAGIGRPGCASVFCLRREAGSRWAERTPLAKRQQHRPWDREGASRDRQTGAGQDVARSGFGDTARSRRHRPGDVTGEPDTFGRC
jgi:hypothetical protein